MKKETEPQFFHTSKDFREWLQRNHQDQAELWVGYFKKATGIKSITWSESVDQALCFGWIDGIRKSIDDKSYKIRFTPRKPQSHWSDVNIRKVKELKKLRLMTESGLTAFSRRSKTKSRQASYEQHKVVLRKDFKIKLMENTKAWNYFQEQSPTYQKQSIWWVMSAKKEETKMKRLNILIDSSSTQKVIPPMKWARKEKH